MSNFNYTNLTPFKFFVLENFPFIAEDFDALTNYQLICKLAKEMNKIIDSTNLTGEQVESLTNAFNELKNYVENYLDNIDIQEDINNKLDYMAEHGELAEIITQYVQMQGILAYNTINELKNAENMVLGSLVKTYGYHSINDGGNASYYIREVINSDVVDDTTIVSIINKPNLVAELIENTVNFEMFGAYGDGIHDDTLALQNCINYIENKNYNTIKANSSKTYLISEPIIISKSSIIDFNYSILKTTSHIDNLIKIQNSERGGTLKNLYAQGNNINRSVVYCDNCANFTFKNSYIIDVPSGAIGLEVTRNGERCFEFKGLNLTIIGNDNITDNTGIKIDTNDCIFDNIIIERCNTGIEMRYGAILNNIHMWVYTGQYQTSIGLLLSRYFEAGLISNIIFDGFYKDIVAESTFPILTINNVHSYIGNNNYPDNSKYFLTLSEEAENLPLNINGGMIKAINPIKCFICNYKTNMKIRNVVFDRCVNTNSYIAYDKRETNQDSLVSGVKYNVNKYQYDYIRSWQFEFNNTVQLNAGTSYKLVNITALRIAPIQPRDYMSTTTNGKKFKVQFDRDGGNFNIIPIDNITANDTFNVNCCFVDNVVNYNPVWQ